MNILVTGATGLIGQNLIARLSTNREIKIWGLSRIRGTNPKVTYIEGDISNVNLYEKLSSQIDVFVHTAAQMKYGNPEEIKSTINTNIMGTARLYNFIKSDITLELTQFSVRPFLYMVRNVQERWESVMKKIPQPSTVFQN